MKDTAIQKFWIPALLIVAGIVLLTQPAKTIADEVEQRLKRFDALIEVPRVEHSLEWAVDSSDVIASAVVRDPGKLPELKSVLKPVGKTEVTWPPLDQDRFRAILELYQPGDKILFCLRFDKAGKSPQVYHFFPLMSLKDPRRSQSSDEFYHSLPETMDGTIKMYASRRRMYSGFVHLAVDKEGKTVRDSDELLKRVTGRIAARSRVPADCDRNAVEQDKSEYGGFFTYVPLDDTLLSSAEFPMMLVPPEPEFREYYTRTDKNGRLRDVSLRLVNYRDDGVIALLKATLSDQMILEWSLQVSDGSQVGVARYTLEKGQPRRKVPGEDEGTVKVVRTFYKRKLAYECLKRMGVEVEQPELILK